MTGKHHPLSLDRNEFINFFLNQDTEETSPANKSIEEKDNGIEILKPVAVHDPVRTHDNLLSRSKKFCCLKGGVL
jgi:hypothetical protein